MGYFLSIATTLFEKRIGYWLAYLIPTVLFFISPLIILMFCNRITRRKGQPEAFSNIIAVTILVIKRTGFRFHDKTSWETARPSSLISRGIYEYNGKRFTWDDQFIDDLMNVGRACKIFCFFFVYYLSELGTSLISIQAASLTTNGTPNDILANLQTALQLILAFLIPLCIYPYFRNRGVTIGPIASLKVAFCAQAMSLFIGAIIQWQVYRTSPCGYSATGCTKGIGVSGISVWVQAPIYTLNAIASVLSSGSIYEIAYEYAPDQLKSLLLSVPVAMLLLSQLVALGLSPVVKDPYLIWIWLGPGFGLLVQTAVFCWIY